MTNEIITSSAAWILLLGGFYLSAYMFCNRAARKAFLNSRNPRRA